jgi:FKBP-type peptidyl-prolyl cis-trans isomerase FkpA
MKKSVYLVYLSLAAFGLYAEAIAEETALRDEKARISYAFGQVLGSDLRQTGLDFDYTAFTQGFKDMLSGGSTRYTMNEAIQMVQGAFQAALAKQAGENRQKEEAFLAENANKENMLSTGSGLQYEILSEGTGGRPAGTDTVRVNYEGSFIDGRIFDSSYVRGEAVELPLDRVISGWAEGIQLMSVGSIYRFYIPSRLAYGEQGAGQTIPPNTTLIFKVELLDIITPPEE